MLIRYFKIGLVVIGVMMAQIGVLPALNADKMINLPMFFLVLSILFLNNKEILVAALAGGLLFDIYIGHFFGFFAVAALLMLMLINLVRHKILQNRNLRVFILLNWIAVLGWHIIYMAPVYIKASLTGIDIGSVLEWRYHARVVWQLWSQTGLILILYWWWPGLRNKLRSEIIY